MVAGCTNPYRREYVEKWHVVKGKDPMNDAEICRIMGDPTPLYTMTTFGRVFKIRPMVERYGAQVSAGFTTQYPGIDTPVTGAVLSMVEYRFDGSPPVTVTGTSAFVLLVTDTPQFIRLLKTSQKLVYRVDGRLNVEYRLAGLEEKLAECGIDDSAIAANIDLSADSNTTLQNTNSSNQKPMLGVLLQELPNALISGILVTNVFPNTPAARVGLTPGDFITAVNGKPVSDLRTFISLLPEQTGIPTTLQVRRISGAIVELHPDL